MLAEWLQHDSIMLIMLHWYPAWFYHGRMQHGSSIGFLFQVNPCSIMPWLLNVH